MTARERFRAILAFEQPDAPLLVQWMGFSEPTLQRWRGEGMPATVCPEEYLGLAGVIALPVSVFPCPARDDIVLEQGSTYRIVRNNRDLTIRYDDGAPHTPQFLDFPVECRDDWQRYRDRINPGCDARFDGLRASAGALRASDRPLVLGLRGCWEIRYFLGLERACSMLHDDPELVAEMLEFWFAHQWDVLDRACELVVPDAVCIWEDLAYRNGPFVSPAMYRKHFAPFHRETSRRLRRLGVKHFLVDCDGNLDLMLPLFLENGITGTFPLECQAGADPVKYRERYGSDVQMIGGIDKRALIESNEATAAEVDHKLMSLARGSGFLPCLDHAVPPEVSLDAFRYYVNHLRESWSRMLA